MQNPVSWVPDCWQHHVASVLPHRDIQVPLCRCALQRFSFYFNFFARNRFFTECMEALLRKYVSGNALLSLTLLFFLFFACNCQCRLLK